MDEKYKQLFYQIAELRRRAEWTYKAQFSQAECYHNKNNWLNISAIIASGLSSLFAISNGVGQLCESGSEPWISFVAAGISAVGTIILACNQNLGYAKKIPDNVEVGAKVWRIYLDLGSLLTDLHSNKCTYEQAVARREAILDRWTNLSLTAPLTFGEAINDADEKLNKRGDNDYSTQELDKSLPDYLRID
ncbi:MAG: SLATT domain-containing protein [Paramuribaculum sp.]|nr:SLATT domain-containing protein [Paramuribaculum sp.]